MSALRLKADEGWWQDVAKLIERSMGIYAKLERDAIQVTAQKVIEHREWNIKESELFGPIKDLQFLYVPKKLFPGPMFVFPEIDTEGKLRAQTKPLHTMFGPSKYFSIGTAQEDFLGPIWLGNSPETLAKIAQCGYVILVEGPFDLLAAKAVAPNLPIMSSLTKTIGRKHEEYLRIIGVKTIYLMYDNDDAGNKSMQILTHAIKTMKVVPLACPDSDPSDCLKSRVKKDALQRVLEGVE
jgi:5S rRNA maturation endonuclease (ribonuclease M5)